MREYKKLPWLIGLLVTAWLNACAPDGDLESIMVFSNVAVSKKTQCIAETGGGASSETRPIGVLDLMASNHYWMFPMMYNGLTTTQNTVELTPAEISLDSHTIAVRGAWVTYQIDGLLGHWDGDTETVLEKQWVPTSGSILPLAFMTFQIEAVPPPIALALDNDIAFDTLGSAGTLTLGVTIEGTLGDGTVVHTQPFYYPITVCRGCLTTYDVRPSLCCNKLIEPDFHPCFPGQDERYSCQIGCWLVYRDQVTRYAQKMAMFEGYTNSLADDLDTLPLPDEFLTRAGLFVEEEVPEEAPEEEEIE